MTLLQTSSTAALRSLTTSRTQLSAVVTTPSRSGAESAGVTPSLINLIKENEKKKQQNFLAFCLCFCVCAVVILSLFISTYLKRG